MASSTLPSVKARLVTLLAGDPGLSGVQISYGVPDPIEREAVYVGGTRDHDQEWSALGARGRAEHYALELVISVWQPGADQQTVTERAFALLAVVEAILRGDPSLGLALTGVKSLVAEIRPSRLVEGPFDDGRVGELQGTIAVDARI